MTLAMAASGSPSIALFTTLRDRDPVPDCSFSSGHTLAGSPSGNLRLTPRRRDGIQ